MSIPTSHKLAPFLNSFEPNCEAPIAAYASYCTDNSSWRGATSDAAIQTARGRNDEELHLTSPADFFKEVFSRKLDLLLDLFCVESDSGLTLYYLFNNSRQKYRFSLSFDLPEDFHVPSLSPYYESANWLERECFDLFGIRFENHPHLSRLLLYPEFAGHPLRKNYPIDKAQPLIPIYA